jgi:hypothetical protein
VVAAAAVEDMLDEVDVEEDEVEVLLYVRGI